PRGMPAVDSHLGPSLDGLHHFAPRLAGGPCRVELVVCYPNNRAELPGIEVFGRHAREIGAPMLVTNRTGRSRVHDCGGGCVVYSGIGEVLASANREGVARLFTAPIAGLAATEHFKDCKSRERGKRAEIAPPRRQERARDPLGWYGAPPCAIACHPSPKPEAWSGESLSAGRWRCCGPPASLARRRLCRRRARSGRPRAESPACP